MILIADSGSTKTAWGLWDGGRLVGSVKTAGINPYYQEEADIATTIGGELVPALGGVMVLFLWCRLRFRGEEPPGGEGDQPVHPGAGRGG